ncbi:MULTISPECIES: DUF262 domain-containing protein [unclassified Flavobacterium]|uniref:DUF262 domain-containing protein n=1 Tax=unclassified Flavobacterium TaxID=196869 RepID=UPI00131EB6F3|nr:MULTISPECIES: DUF262 domain-containing protein [unclassified Flavobacterium]
MGTTNTEQVQEFSVKTLLSTTGEYTIPVYQRNYAWEETQIRQLIKDIIDSLKKSSTKKYYIGTLIVDKTEINNKSLFETIDGQQRLTTLNILLIAIKNYPQFKHINTEWFERLNLSFSNRQKSEEALLDLFGNSKIESKKYNPSILDAYDLVISILNEEIKESGDVTIETFTDYLFHYVTILRVEVPPQTDLNHYFEIMNNRGEQLEKHEVLKARLLESFDFIKDLDVKEKNSHVFHTIWEACANMEKYVQYGFPVDVRHNLFDSNNWDNFKAENFDEVLNQFGEIKNQKHQEAQSIDQIIKKPVNDSSRENASDENPERFYSVINFSNFLLHVIRVTTKQDILLDDKKLLDSFEEIVNEKTDEEKMIFSQNFAFSLLKTKYLFDKFIIKRDTSKQKEEWSLSKMKNSKQQRGNSIAYTASYPNSFEDIHLNRQLVQLLSMFHVSIPTLSYKHWLNAALHYVYENPKTSAEDYINFLERTAETFIYNRIVAHEPQEYYKMIYHPQSMKLNNPIDITKFSFGSITNNLLFNYVDYLLWKREVNKESKDSKIMDFKFTSRSSVEHYYPQNPKEGFPKMKDLNALNCFGNLCLISHSKNSSLSNFSPLSKAEFYLKGDIDSIKQYIMLRNADNWDVEAIQDHQKEIFQLLKIENE